TIITQINSVILPRAAANVPDFLRDKQGGRLCCLYINNYKKANTLKFTQKMSSSSTSKDGPSSKRYRRDDEEKSSSDSDDNYVPYVPVKERKKQQLLKLGRLGQLKDEGKAKSSSENENENDEEDGQVWGRKSNISLLDQHTELKKLAEAKKESAMERQLKEEERILESVAESKALMGVAELAKGIQYEDPIKTRKTPFTRREREIILCILRKHASILGNKKTDANTSHLKKIAWQQIGLEYNSMEEVQEQVTSKQLLKVWENMRRKYKPEIQAKVAECPDITMEDEIDVMLSALSGADYSSLPFNGDGTIEVILNELSSADGRNFIVDEDSDYVPCANKFSNGVKTSGNFEQQPVTQCTTSNTSNIHKTWDCVLPNQSETCDTHISTTSGTNSRSKNFFQHQNQATLDFQRQCDEIQDLKLELARQEVREQTARAQEAEYRMLAAKEAVRGARAKADMAELELTQKRRGAEPSAC
ncbi:ATP-dependent RNA helicase abstrakt, partial [Frankliniella fusca]